MRIHSLPALVAEARAIDPQARKFEDSAMVLDAYYAPTRYADAPVKLDYTRLRVQDAIDRSQALVDWLRTQIEARLAGEEAPLEHGA